MDDTNSFWFIFSRHPLPWHIKKGCFYDANDVLVDNGILLDCINEMRKDPLGNCPLCGDGR